MTTVQEEPVIWRWVALLLVFSVMIWGILEITASGVESRVGEVDTPAADTSASSETLDEVSAPD